MGLWAALIHGVNLVLPALVVATLLALLPMRPAPSGWRARARLGAVLAAVGVGELVFGMVLWGRDGMMATYGALVLVMGSVAWWMARGR